MLLANKVATAVSRRPLDLTTMANSKDSLNQSRLIKVMVSRYTQHIHRRAVQYTRPMAINAGSFQGDPDTIAETQIKMEQAAQRIQNGQQ